MQANNPLNYAVVLDNDKLNQSAEEASRTLKNIGNNGVQAANTMDSAFKNLAITIGGVFTLQKASEFINDMVRVRGEVQALQISYETLLGSKFKADQMISEMQTYAVKTPLFLNEIAKAGQLFLSFGISAQNIMPYVKMVGDISMGNAVKFQGLSLAFAQMHATGRLMGQDLLQMISQGFNPLSIISEKTGKSVAALKDEMEKGAISSQMVIDAFKSVTQEGGRFYGMLEKQSAGIEGVKSNFKGAIDELYNSFGEKNQDAIVGTYKFGTSLVQNYQEVGYAIAALVATYGTYRAALIVTTELEKLNLAVTTLRRNAMAAHCVQMSTFSALTDILKGKTAALNSVLLANPYAIVAASVVALGFAFYKLATYQTDAEKATSSLNDIRNQESRSLNSEIYQVRLMFERLRLAKIGTEEYAAAKKAIISQYGDYLKGLGDEKDALNDISAAYRLITSEAIKASRARTMQKLTEKAGDLVSDKQSEVYDNVKKLLEKKFGSAKGSNGLKLSDEYLLKIRPVIMDEAKVTPEINSIIDKFTYSVTRSVGTVSVYTKETANKLREELNSLVAVQNAVSKSMEDATRKYGTLTADTVNPNTKTAEEIAAEEKAREEREAAEKAAARKEKTAAAQRLKALEEYNREYANSISRSYLEIENIRVGAMKEGLDKELAQAKLNYDSLLQANKEREAKMIEELQKTRKNKVKYTDLSDDQRNQLSEFNRVALENYQYSSKQIYVKMLSDVQTYEERRQKIVADYAKRETEIRKSGGSTGNIEENNRQKDEALKAIDSEFASRSETFKAWMNSISNYTLEQLQEVLSRAKRELYALEGVAGVDQQKLAEARAKVETTQKEIKEKKASNSYTVEARSIKSWEDLYRTLTDCNKEFREIGQTVGGTAGKIISSTGQILTSSLSAINGIIQLAHASTTGVQVAASGASQAIKTVEKASVILTIISAALQIATTLFSLFKKTDYMKEFREEIEKLNLDLKLVKLNSDLNKDERGIFGDDLWKKAKNNVDGLREALELYNSTLEAIADRKKYIGLLGVIADMEGIKNGFDSAAQSIANMQIQIRHSTWFRSAKYASLKDAVPELFDANGEINQEALKSFIGTDTFKKLSSENQKYLKELSEYWASYSSYMSEVSNYLNNIFGDLGNNLLDSLVTAFTSGTATDAAKQYVDSVSEMLEDLGTQMIYSATFSTMMSRYQEQMKTITQNAGLSDEEKFSSYAALLKSLTTEAASKQGLFNSLLQQYKDIAAASGFDILQAQADASSREAVTKSGITASQDSVDELTGRATTIQGHTFSIAESQKLLVLCTQTMLTHIINIDNNTARLQGIETTLSDIKNYGVKLL